MSFWTAAFSGLALASAAAPPRLGGDVAVLLAALPSAPAGGPALAPLWSAKVEQGMASTSGLQGTFAYDQAGKRWRVTGCSNTTLFHEAGDELCMDQLAISMHGATPFETNMTMGSGLHATCKVEPYPFYDLFGILAIGKKTGTSVVSGVPCDVWYAAVETQGRNVSATACIAADGVPRLFNMSTGMAYKAASHIAYRFWDPTIGGVPPAAFEATETCRTRYPTPACAGSGTKELSIYRVHSKAEPYSLENRNAGDALGDMAFFCDIIGMDASQIVTLWSVTADTAWGQYAFCLYTGGKNMCWGHTANKVGRESALGIGNGTSGNQCEANEDVGSWYSFPDSGQCPAGQAVGTDGCTWAAKPVRSVVAGCIIKDRGLQQSCAQERGHAPMLKSSAIFAAALASDDPAKGGCPDAPAELIVV